MNWVWIAMLMEALAKILGDCPEQSKKKRRSRLFKIARGKRRFFGSRKMLKAIRQTPLVDDTGMLLVNDESLVLPKGRESIRLLKKVSLEIQEMSDDDLASHIDTVCELHEDE